MMTLKFLPNLITLFRLCLLPLFISALLGGHAKVAFCLFFVAGLSDGLDGWLARRFHWQSRLGSVLDPLSDKLFVASSYLTLGHFGILPQQLVALVLIRDLVIITGVSLCRYLVGDVNYYSTFLGKWTAFLQGLVIFLAIFSQAFIPLPALLFNTLLIIATLTTVTSGIDYMVIGYRLIQRRRHATHPSH